MSTLCIEHWSKSFNHKLIQLNTIVLKMIIIKTLRTIIANLKVLILENITKVG